jgi:hypothetical protein
MTLGHGETTLVGNEVAFQRSPQSGTVRDGQSAHPLLKLSDPIIKFESFRRTHSSRVSSPLQSTISSLVQKGVGRGGGNSVKSECWCLVGSASQKANVDDNSSYPASELCSSYWSVMLGIHKWKNYAMCAC